MRCPHCQANESRVLESRMLEDDTCLRRRRECQTCRRRYTTYERAEVLPLMVLKRDGHREPFDPRKLATGLLRACVKTEVKPEQIEDLVAGIEAELIRRYEREAPASAIGELTLERLRALDEVAYVRFASVYRHFASIADFVLELRTLQEVQPL